MAIDKLLDVLFGFLGFLVGLFPDIPDWDSAPAGSPLAYMISANYFFPIGEVVDLMIRAIPIFIAVGVYRLIVFLRGGG